MKRARSIVSSLTAVPFVRDLLALNIGSVVNLGITLASSIVYARILGISGYGLYAVILAFAGTISAIVNWGQHGALVTFLAEQYGKKSKSGMGYVLSYYISVSVITGILILLVAWWAPAITMRLYGDATIGVVARLALISMMLNPISGLFLGVMQTVREIKLLTVLEQGSALVYLIVSSTLLLMGYGVASLFVSKIAIAILSVPVFLWYYRMLAKKYPLPTFRQFFRLSWKPWKEYVSQGGLIGVDKSVNNLFPNIFFVVLRTASNDATVGIARIVFQIGAVPYLILVNQALRMAGSVLPTVAQAGQDVLRRTAVKLLKHTLFFHTLISLGCLVAAPICILFFYGRDYAPTIEPSLWLILISILTALNVNNVPLLRLMRKTYVSSVLTIVSLVLSYGALHLFLKHFDPITAFLLVTLVFYGLTQSVTFYVYVILLRRKKRPPRGGPIIDVTRPPTLE